MAFVLWLAFGGGGSQAAPDPVAPADTLEVKVYGVEECAEGWRRVGQDRGWRVTYLTASGHLSPYWVDETTVRRRVHGARRSRCRGGIRACEADAPAGYADHLPVDSDGCRRVAGRLKSPERLPAPFQGSMAVETMSTIVTLTDLHDVDRLVNLSFVTEIIPMSFGSDAFSRVFMSTGREFDVKHTPAEIDALIDATQSADADELTVAVAAITAAVAATTVSVDATTTAVGEVQTAIETKIDAITAAIALLPQQT